ncbi:MAG: four helix bundle protein [Candidatus Zixiibacteriota bacterium]
MALKFEKLEVWQLSLEYVDKIYDLARLLPHKEEYNLKTQLIRAATSISLNIAEGSTGQSDLEFKRFVGIAVRSCVEVIACLHLAKRRLYIDEEVFRQTYDFGERLLVKLQALRKRLK